MQDTRRKPEPDELTVLCEIADDPALTEAELQLVETFMSDIIAELLSGSTHEHAN